MAIQNQNLPDNPHIEVIKSGRTGLFTNYIFKAIPLAFDESLSYYECLCALLDYLKNTIIPTVNNNADAVAELQTLYEELRSYVNDYFTNLDVQEEINNKLDAMVEDGTLETIINQEIFGDINDRLDTIESERTIFIGDSYGAGVTNESEVFITSWIDYMIQKMHLTTGNYYKIATPGAGFIRQGTSTNMNFLQSLQAEINNITNKDTIKNIIVCGGYNDNTYQLADIQRAITTFVNYCKTNFPNATVYIGEIAYRYGNSSSDVTTKLNIQNVVYNAYANCTPSSANRTNEYIYLHGVENILKSSVKNYMYENNAHPKEDGQKALANGIYQAFKKGICENYTNNSGTITPVNSGTSSGELYFTYHNENFMISLNNLTFNWTEENNMSLTNGGTKLADVTANDFIGTVTPIKSSIACFCNIQDYNLGRYIVPCQLFFDKDGSLMVYLWGNNSSTGQSITFTSVKQMIFYRATTCYPAIFM